MRQCKIEQGQGPPAPGEQGGPPSPPAAPAAQVVARTPRQVRDDIRLVVAALFPGVFTYEVGRDNDIALLIRGPQVTGLTQCFHARTIDGPVTIGASIATPGGRQLFDLLVDSGVITRAGSRFVNVTGHAHSFQLLSEHLGSGVAAHGSRALTSYTRACYANAVNPRRRRSNYRNAGDPGSGVKRHRERK